MRARLAVARAALDPTTAIESADQVEPEMLEVVAGVPAPERVERARALTLAVEVDAPPPHSRWRFLLFYALVRLAAWVYPFKFELYRTRAPWE